MAQKGLTANSCSRLIFTLKLPFVVKITIIIMIIILRIIMERIIIIIMNCIRLQVAPKRDESCCRLILPFLVQNTIRKVQFMMDSGAPYYYEVGGIEPKDISVRASNLILISYKNLIRILPESLCQNLILGMLPGVEFSPGQKRYTRVISSHN